MADIAAGVLKDAWLPPCLHYTPEYLSWQFAFPGRQRAMAVLARVDGEPVGFAGSTPRRVRLGEREMEIHIVSFVSVRRAWQGRGIAARLYDGLLGALRAAGVAVLAFAKPATAGERSLLKAFLAAGLETKALAPHQPHGYRPRREPFNEFPAVKHDKTFSNPAEFPAPREGASVLWAAPDRLEWAHNASDPRGRVLLSALSPSGASLGAAIASRVEIATLHGIEATIGLEAIMLEPAVPATLAGLLEAATGLWSTQDPPSVTASSLAPFAALVSRVRGLRRIPGDFNAFLAAPAGSPILEAGTTNLAVT